MTTRSGKAFKSTVRRSTRDDMDSSFHSLAKPHRSADRPTIIIPQHKSLILKGTKPVNPASNLVGNEYDQTMVSKVSSAAGIHRSFGSIPQRANCPDRP